MMPKTSVRPAAMRNSMTPNCRPFSVWISSSVVDIAAAAQLGKGRGRCLRKTGAGCCFTGACLHCRDVPAGLTLRNVANRISLPLHRTILVIGVLIVLGHESTQGNCGTAVVVRNPPACVRRLDREVVVAKLEIASDAVGLGAPQGIANGVRFGKVALYRPDSGIDQGSRIIALGGIAGGDISV